VIGKEIEEDELQQEQRQQGLGAGSGGRRRRAGAARLHLQEVDLPPLLRQLLHRPALHQQVTLPALLLLLLPLAGSWFGVLDPFARFVRSHIPRSRIHCQVDTISYPFPSTIVSRFPVAHKIRGSWPPPRRPTAPSFQLLMAPACPACLALPGQWGASRTCLQLLPLLYCTSVVRIVLVPCPLHSAQSSNQGE
jgi:hypothetical protein